MAGWWQRGAARLVGRWKLVRVDGDMPVGDGIILSFAADGTATSLLRDSAGDQLVQMRYRVTGTTLVTEQAAQPGAERTRFRLEDADHLILHYGPNRLWFLRVPDTPRRS